jgi:hypothetical protein
VEPPENADAYETLTFPNVAVKSKPPGHHLLPNAENVNERETTLQVDQNLVDNLMDYFAESERLLDAESLRANPFRRTDLNNREIPNHAVPVVGTGGGSVAEEGRCPATLGYRSLGHQA